jgi:hypothetical protein
MKTYPPLPVVAGSLAMRAGGQTSVCGLSFSFSGIGTIITQLKKLDVAENYCGKG